MSSTALLRPGIALGNYPQREDLRDSWLDRAAASLAGFVRQQAAGRNPGHQAFIALVKGRPVYPALSDRTMEFDGTGKCLAGC